MFLILPHQLFAVKFLDKKENYILWEHPHYFTAYNYNKKKLLLHRGSMRYYYEYLKEHGLQVRYLTFTKQFDPAGKRYSLFDPIDSLDVLQLPGEFDVVESPNFLLDKQLHKKYRDKTDNFFFNAFYMWAKKELGILSGVKSQDKKNRTTFASFADQMEDTSVPNIPSNKKDDVYIGSAARYVNKNFSKNYGETGNFIFPLTHKTARMWLKKFVKDRLVHFGDYQDVISQEHDYLFHSMLSTSLNIGLLNPSDIIDEVQKIKNKKSVGLNNIEGFVRQLFWREYQRYCYRYFDFKQYKKLSNCYFKSSKRITKAWYTGSLKVDPVDDCIKKAFSSGYLHHIERLMVVGNYMNLCGMNPWHGLKWFMEFACDSYEWVMHQNVLEMVFFVSGGGTMRRPYSSSSNYILKMSSYKKNKWCDRWDKQYHSFIKTNKSNLKKYRFFFGNAI